MKSRSRGLFPAVLFLFLLCIGFAAPVKSGAVTFTEFPLPVLWSNPREITWGPDGNLWFTENGTNQIGRMTPAGVITEFPLPAADSQPLGIASGPDGNLWFTEENGNRIGRITPTGVITEFPLPTALSHPQCITSGPDGNLWFTEYWGDKIGRITPAGVVTEFPVPTADSDPGAITVGPDGNLWFTQGNWFQGGNGGKVVRFNLTGDITEFPFPMAASYPRSITAGPKGNLWFAHTFANQIVRITPAGDVTEFPLPTAGSEPTGITAGPDGNLWFTESGNKIGRFLAWRSYYDALGLVTKYYRDVLDRDPEAGGAEWWTDQTREIVFLGIAARESFLALTKFFFNSEEYALQGKDNALFVRDLYQAFFDREPDSGGWDFWVDYLAQGLTRNMLLTQFAYSEEYTLYLLNRFGGEVTRPESNLVNDLYRGFLNRFPEPAGFRAWLALMREAQCTAGQAVRDTIDQIALSFTQSAEYQMRNRSNSEYVEDLYNAILRRGADPEGFAQWVSLLNSGAYTREQLLQFFTGSPEFQYWLEEIYYAGCLP